MPFVIFSVYTQGTPAFSDQTLTELLFSRSTRVPSGQSLESFILAQLKHYLEKHNGGLLSRIPKEIQVKALQPVFGYGYSCVFISDDGVKLTKKIGEHEVVAKIFANGCRRRTQVLHKIRSRSGFALRKSASGLAHVAAFLGIVIGGAFLFVPLVNGSVALVVKVIAPLGREFSWPQKGVGNVRYESTTIEAVYTSPSGRVIEFTTFGEFTLLLANGNATLGRISLGSKDTYWPGSFSHVGSSVSTVDGKTGEFKAIMPLSPDMKGHLRRPSQLRELRKYPRLCGPSECNEVVTLADVKGIFSSEADPKHNLPVNVTGDFFFEGQDQSTIEGHFVMELASTNLHSDP
ncbi:hypothetical protein BO98_02130 [Candidatus Synechococcus spongiarum LMB bulk10D]|nr:hypothetical protein BO98_02130 [Candidatus Synechococcus spongiarum LMB bulk10D]